MKVILCSIVFVAKLFWIQPVFSQENCVVLHDFVKNFKQHTQVAGLPAEVSSSQISGNRSLPGIFLHPGQAPGEIRFAAIALPDLPRPGACIKVIAWVGLRNGVPWGKKEAPRPDGVTFEIRLGKTSLVRKQVDGPGWQSLCVDISEHAGKTVTLSFLTHKAGTTDYDWAVFGRPLLILQKEDRPDWRLPGILVIDDVGLTNGLPVSGGQSEIFVKLSNQGYGKTLPDQKVSVFYGRKKGGQSGDVLSVPVLSPGDAAVVRFGAMTLPDQKRISVTAQCMGREMSRNSRLLPACSPMCSLSGITTDIIFYGTGDRIHFAEIRRKGWGQPLAALYPLAAIARTPESAQPQSFQVRTYQAERLELVCDMPDGVMIQTWSAAGDVFDFETALKPRNTMPLFHVSGPAVLWGQGGLGPAHDFALLPGIEYLDANDHSSSRRVADPPHHDHHVPHPLYHTAQCAAMSGQDAVLALMWDPGQAWLPGKKRPLLYFDVPALKQDKDFAEMKLFVPSTAEGVAENALFSEAALPVSEELTLTGRLLAAGRTSPDLALITEKPRAGDLVLGALKKYYSLYDAVAPVDPPRDWLSEKRLSRTGWLKSVYVPGKGTRHCVGDNWSPHPTPGVFTLLMLDALDTGGREGEDLLKTVQAWTDDAVRQHGPGYLASRINCHIMGGDYFFYSGHLAAGLKASHDAAMRVARGMTPEGGTRWYPGKEPRRLRLGRPGQVTSGNTARTACQLAYFARITGDAGITRQALKALAHLEKFRVPRGAQGWECPLHCPDILTSAYAVLACVDAYHYTGDAEYLDRARYWAWTGMPFVYAWGVPDIPSMEGNTIPILGATFFNHTWIGRPVVWCGLVYAYGLYHLAGVDKRPPSDEFNWDAVARAITHSAMHQQYAEPGPSQGCYPDSFHLKVNKRVPADIHPEDIMVNLWMDRGMDPRVKTRIVRSGGGRLHISSGADIVKVQPDHERLSVTLRFFPNQPVYVFIGLLKDTAYVTINGKAAPVLNGATWQKAGAGCMPLAAPQGVAVKGRAGPDGVLTLELPAANGMQAGEK